MELSELIKTLEGAQEKATEGEWQCKQHRLLQMNGLYRASADRFSDAQAIADRHNTADLTIHYLKVLVATEQRVVDSMRSIERWRTRAESAEAEVERLKASKEDPTP